MIAGSKSDPIHFTNLIYDDSLYTLTYKWPGLSKKERGVCVKLSDNFNLDFFNWWPGQSIYVGKEILLGKQRRKVNHFRGVVVVPALPPGNYDRAPLISADFYVDSDDSATFWQVLHSGVHNKFDPALDEWFEMDSFKKKAGKVELPDKCKKIGIGDADDGNWFPELDLDQ